MRHLNLPGLFATRVDSPSSNRSGEERPGDDGEALPSCGWYDSSNDLRQGLDVIEFEAAPDGGIMVAAAQAGAAR